MLKAQAIVDPAAAQAAAAGSAGASVLSILQEWTMAALGVPIGVPLGGLAGIFYGIAFRESMSVPRLWTNVILCDVLVSFASPLVTTVMAKMLGASLLASAPIMAGIAAVLGFGTQYMHPWLKRRRDRLLDGAADRVFGRRRDEDDDEEGRR